MQKRLTVIPSLAVESHLQYVICQTIYLIITHLAGQTPGGGTFTVK